MNESPITKRVKYGYEIFDISGEISYDEIRLIEDFIKQNTTGDYKKVVINMLKVPFINSSALSLLVKLIRDMQNRDINLYLMNLNETIRGLLDMTGSTKHFNIIKNEEILVNELKNKELDDILNEI